MRQPVLQSTEGLSIELSAAEVWPWLVQMGQDRGELYGYVLLENSFGLQHRTLIGFILSGRSSCPVTSFVWLPEDGWD